MTGKVTSLNPSSFRMQDSPLLLRRRAGFEGPGVTGTRLAEKLRISVILMVFSMLLFSGFVPGPDETAKSVTAAIQAGNAADVAK